MNELSEVANKFIKNINGSRVLPYKIKGSWWFISDTVCRKCEDTKTVTLFKGKDGKEDLTEPELADRLWTFYEEITAPGEPTPNETAELKELYDSVQRMDVSYKDSTHADAMEALGKLLLSLTDSEIEELIKRSERLPKLIDYADGCSYRHRN